jgi:hypothetical protein
MKKTYQIFEDLVYREISITHQDKKNLFKGIVSRDGGWDKALEW